MPHDSFSYDTHGHWNLISKNTRLKLHNARICFQTYCLIFGNEIGDSRRKNIYNIEKKNNREVIWNQGKKKTHIK